ncbi:MAG: hypothetical protein MJZ75_03175 [Paludibacteraceae bacterium]|nr:hypothetical protein [Paludibacteraceae bacterium]
MKKQLLLVALLPLLCGCGLVRIVTEAPVPVKTTTVVTTPVVTTAPAVIATPVYTTTVTTPKVRTVTTTQVTALNEDFALHLDLQTIAAAFAQANTVQEFEQLINNSSYMLSNLDLNRDGYVDYLRVLETVSGYTHVFLIQAVLAANVYQDVATLVCELPKAAIAYVQIIGAPYIYGPNYIIQPVYPTPPYIYNRLMVVNYRPWQSPWYWNHYPACYRHPAPKYLPHYQAYVTTFMTNNRYCQRVTYPSTCHYTNYETVTRTIQRHDYEQQYPERSFSSRNAARSTATQVSSSSSSRTANASDLRSRQAATTTTQSTPTSRSTASGTSSSRSTASSTTTSRSTSSATAAKPATTTTTTTARSTSSATAAKPATTTTTTSRSTSSATAAKPATTTTTTSRSTSSATATKPATTTTTTSRSTSSATTANPTVTSRVRNNGSATTRTTPSATSASRSSSSSTSSRSAASSSSTSSRSAASSSSTSSRSAASSSSSRR